VKELHDMKQPHGNLEARKIFVSENDMIKVLPISTGKVKVHFIQGGKLIHDIDIWSLALLLFQMATGKSLHETEEAILLSGLHLLIPPNFSMKFRNLLDGLFREHWTID
jgi:hypothetical protein